MSIEEIYNFIGGFVPKEHIKLHIEYGTCLWLLKKGKIEAYVQWNIKKATAHITFLKIGNVNSYKTMFYFIREGKKKFPYVKHMIFERELIGDFKKRVYII